MNNQESILHHCEVKKKYKLHNLIIFSKWRDGTKYTTILEEKLLEALIPNIQPALQLKYLDQSLLMW